MVGDRVLISEQAGGSGVIEAILPRTTVLAKPAVANVEQAIVVFTLAEPTANLPLVDRFLVMAERAGLSPALCLNKVDLSTPAEAEAAEAVYRPTGYPMTRVSAILGDGLDGLRSLITGRVSVLAGQSGTGKSTLLNVLVPGLQLRTGAVSRKVSRGTHTTRHVELVEVAHDGIVAGVVADTPGFTGIEFSSLPSAQLGECFPEIRRLTGGCRFQGCMHAREPGCVVRAAAGGPGLAGSRYESYERILGELMAAERSRYR
jgi:ribosome biogenesis GTPase